MKHNVPQEILDLIRATPGLKQPEGGDVDIETLNFQPESVVEPSVYKGGVSSGVETSGVKKGHVSVTRAQEIFKEKDFSPTTMGVEYFLEHYQQMKPTEVFRWLATFIKHESPEVKPIEGQIQGDSNISVNLIQINQNNGKTDSTPTAEDLCLKGKTISIDEASELGKSSTQIPGPKT